MTNHSDLAAYFYERVLIDDNGCWLWQLSLNHAGYGQMRAPTGMRPVHRVSYEVFVGPIPAGLEIDHLCRVRRCLNPEHLEPVTHQENIRRGEWIPAVNQRKTHCKRGHEFTPENTGSQACGGRICKICNRAKAAAQRERQRRSVA